MATYLIEGTVTAWPEGTVDIEVSVTSESGGNNYDYVNLNNGQYALTINAEAGERVWIKFIAGNLLVGPGFVYTANKVFGPFVIDDIGVLP